MEKGFQQSFRGSRTLLRSGVHPNETSTFLGYDQFFSQNTYHRSEALLHRTVRDL